MRDQFDMAGQHHWTSSGHSFSYTLSIILLNCTIYCLMLVVSNYYSSTYQCEEQ